MGYNLKEIREILRERLRPGGYTREPATWLKRVRGLAEREWDIRETAKAVIKICESVM